MHPKPGDRRPPEDDPQPRIPGALRELDELLERVRRENPELAAALKAASDELPDYSDPGAVRRYIERLGAASDVARSRFWASAPRRSASPPLRSHPGR